MKKDKYKGWEIEVGNTYIEIHVYILA